jgi:hypothetical protein
MSNNPLQNSAGVDGFIIISGEQNNPHDGVGENNTSPILNAGVAKETLYTGVPIAGGVIKQQGAQGPMGDKGPTGDKGTQGDPGVTGAPGNQGPAGDQGPVGLQGPDGNQGPVGLQGDKGPMGDKGPTGDQGLQGFQGIQGPVGNQGSQGPVGNQGIQGLPGDKGPMGDVGPQGAAGSPGVGTGNLVISGNTVSTSSVNGVIGIHFDTGGQIKIANTTIPPSILAIGESATVAGTLSRGRVNINLNNDLLGQTAIGSASLGWAQQYVGAPGYLGSSDIVDFFIRPTINADSSMSLKFTKDSVSGNAIEFTGANVKVPSLVFGDGTVQTTSSVGIAGPQGIQGIQGVPGNDGAPGIQGPTGSNGLDGVSIINALVDTNGDLKIALSNDSPYINAGHVVGANGVGIANVSINNEGSLVIQYTDGTPSFSVGTVKGANGAVGNSAYQLAVAGGFVGTEADWLASLVGVAGADGVSIQSATIDNTGSLMLLFSNDSQHNAGNLGLITGITVDEGGHLIISTSNDGSFNAGYVVGPQGIDGLTAYDVAVNGGFVGTEIAWLASLVGAQGVQGVQGPSGLDGAPGAQGIQGIQGDTAWVPATLALYVDPERADTYTETGSVLTPFKTIQAAVDAAPAVTGGEVAIVLAPHVYTDTISITKTRLNFVGTMGTRLTGAITITGTLNTRFTGMSIKGNVTANLAGNSKIDINGCDVGAGADTWNITAIEGAGAAWFQVWGGTFGPANTTITGFRNGICLFSNGNLGSNPAMNIVNCNLQIGGGSLYSSGLNISNSPAIIGGCGTDGAYAVTLDATSTLTTDAAFLGAITLTNNGGTVVNTTKKFDEVPATAIGKVGDKVGMLAVDATYLYACVAAHDGITNIWTRTALSAAW